MDRWSVAVVLGLASVLLAGCTDGEDEPIVVRPMETAAGEPTPEPEYLFTLFGVHNVTADRHVDVRLFFQGRLMGVVGFTAEPDGEMERLQSYLVSSGRVSGDVVSDGEVVQTFDVEPGGCPGGEADAIIEVFDPIVEYGDRSVAVEFGCTA